VPERALDAVPAFFTVGRMTDLTLAPKTDPSQLYRYRDGFYAVDMLDVALVELDFFSWLNGVGPKSLAELAAHFEFHLRPLDVMTTLFVALGLLIRDGDRLSVTEAGREHVVAGSPWNLSPYYPKIKDRPIAQDLLTILRTDKPANFAARKDQGDWHKAMESESFAEEFTAMMDCRGVLLAQALAANLDLSTRSSLLDIAGGSGVYACAFAAKFSGLKACVLDKPPVDKIAARATAKRGFSGRVGTVAADMLTEPLPSGHDVHLYSNVLHDWDVPEVRQLMKASAKALPTGGWLIVHDAFLTAAKDGPLPVAEYSVVLLHITQGRCYSTKEIEDIGAEFGFDPLTHVPSAVGRSAVVLVKR
jgi:3-hydroxy-5-methyl-1-naphthoate 3-O-methyltransferase